MNNGAGTYGSNLVSRGEITRRAALLDLGLDPYPEPMEDVTPPMRTAGERGDYHGRESSAFEAPRPSAVGPPREPVRITEEQRRVLRQEAINAAAVDISDSALITNRSEEQARTVRIPTVSSGSSPMRTVVESPGHAMVSITGEILPSDGGLSGDLDELSISGANDLPRDTPSPGSFVELKPIPDVPRHVWPRAT